MLLDILGSEVRLAFQPNRADHRMVPELVSIKVFMIFIVKQTEYCDTYGHTSNFSEPQNDNGSVNNCSFAIKTVTSGIYDL